ncbi:MAG: alkaline phosphatase family protein [Thermoanaerobaculia bacterium]
MRFAVVLTLLLSVTPTAWCVDRPDLVIVVAIDQFPHEYLDRFAPWFGDGGFKRFSDRGADFPNARYPYAITFTSAGHATIATGRMPFEHGIIANSWYDRSLGKVRHATKDERVRARGGHLEGISPVLLLSDSLGDRLKEHYPGSKVISIALKDDAAALMGARKADAAYWFDPGVPGFASSTYYPARPRVLAFNDSVGAFIANNTTWTRSDLIPAEALDRVTFDPPHLRSCKGERDGLGRSFPHPISNADAFTNTPFAHDLTFAFARHIIEEESLGTNDGAPDLLYVGLSAIDNLGHLFGPDSLEIADAVVRTDRALAAFLDGVSKDLGTRITVALTADHGVQAIPEVAKARGRDAGRIDFYDRKAAKTIAGMSLERRLIEKIAAKRLGIRFDPAAPRDRALVVAFERPALYVNWKRARQLKLDPERVRDAIRDAAVELTGVRAAYTSGELSAPNFSADELERSVRYSFHPDRSGDVIVVLKEGWVWGTASGTGASHGQPVDADQRVPLMLWGHGVKSGKYTTPAGPHDLARTLGSLLAIDAGGADTVVLPCIEK